MIPDSLAFSELSELQRASLDDGVIAKTQIDFIIMRIVSRLQKTGKDIKLIFGNLAKNVDHVMRNEQFILDINKNYYVYITSEEAKMLINYIDSDQSGIVL